MFDYKKTLSAFTPTCDDFITEKSKVCIKYYINFILSLYSATPLIRPPNFQLHWRSAEKLREMCCVNRGCFIKVGQHIGALEYLLPIEYVDVFKVLHSDAPKSTLEEIKQVIKEDLGKDVRNLMLLRIL